MAAFLWTFSILALDLIPVCFCTQNMAVYKKNLASNVSSKDSRISSIYGDSEEDSIAPWNLDQSFSWGNSSNSAFLQDPSTDQRGSNSDPGSQLSLSQHLDFNELLEECFVFEALQNVLSEFDENRVPLSKAERPSSHNSVPVGNEHVYFAPDNRAASEQHIDSTMPPLHSCLSSSSLMQSASSRDSIRALKVDDSSNWGYSSMDSPLPQTSTDQYDSPSCLSISSTSSLNGELLQERLDFEAFQNGVSQFGQKLVPDTNVDGSPRSSCNSTRSKKVLKILNLVEREFELGDRVNTTPTPSNDRAQTDSHSSSPGEHWSSTGVCPVRKLSINGNKESTVDKNKYVLILEKLSSDIVGERLKTDNLEAEPTQDQELFESLKAAPQDSTEPPADRQTDRDADTSDHDVKQTMQHQVEYSQEKRSHELQAKEDKSKEKNRKLKESDISTQEQEPSSPGVSETTRIITDAFANLCRRTKKQVELDQKLGFCLLPFKSRISRRALRNESLEPRLSLNEQPVNPHRQGCVASLPEWACPSQPDYLERAEHGGSRSRSSFPVETARACSAAPRGSRLHATNTKEDRKSAP
ncbi:uncharacterized protein LOC131699008 [Acipenser ruthenus]|uniref:uncharacterized protein LOC131699008 n=1 Tax=Acipenser ruthenus TaxID=7906 RepID=UPI002741FD68|nr:uncharacterized protein LOC131699008 [Acipenser ruthenus]